MTEEICLGFQSARLTWREARMRVVADNPASARVPSLLLRILFDRAEGIDLSSLPSRTRLLRAPESISVPALERLRAERPGIANDVQLCVSERNSRRFVPGTTCHLASGSYPSGSFCRLADGALVASPELTFMQMACVLDRDRLIAYGYELCGYYVRGCGEHGFINCPQITTVERISRYLKRLERLRQEHGEGMPWGFRRARTALAHVRDGAASPEEAVVSMVLTLPGSLGGYGLPVARLNVRVRLGRVAAELFGIDSFVCDLSWNDGAQVLEYHGSQHKQRSRHTFDLRKGNVLAADGRVVVSMGRHMLSRQDLMDEVAKSVCMALGRRWKKPSAQLATRRARLRHKLLRDLDER